jgi:hypothetical protein
MTENSCCSGTGATFLRAPLAPAHNGGARAAVRFKCRCVAVEPEAPPATIDVIAASMVDKADGWPFGDEERARAPETAFGTALDPAGLGMEAGAVALRLRLNEVISRSFEAPAAFETAAEESKDNGRSERAFFDDARASACAAVAFAASLVNSQS